jgi:hypothetical protein
MSDLYLAIELLEQGNPSEAVRELERILSADIENISAWRLLARAVEDPAEMKECYEHILRLDPHDQEAINALHEFDSPEPRGSTSPFFAEDVTQMGYDWLPEEPPQQPGIDTAPLKIVDPFSAVEAPAESSIPPEAEFSTSKQAESALFDEEEEGGSNQDQREKGSLLDNDTFFYTTVILFILAAAAIAYFVFQDSILEFIRTGLPF